MEDIEYLDEYKDIIMPGINKSETRAFAAASGSGSQRRRRISSDSSNSSSIDADIFQKLFHGKFSDDDELPPKSGFKGKGRRPPPPLSPSSSDESNDALEALFSRKINPIIQGHKRRERYESLDSIDDLSEALMRPTSRDRAKYKKSFSQKLSSSSASTNKSTTAVKTVKSSTNQQGKHERSVDVLRSGATNGNTSGKNKSVTIIKPIKSDQTSNAHEPKTDPLNLKEYMDAMDSDSSYEYESDFYGDEEDDDISNAIIDLSTDTSRTNSVAETVTPVVSEDDDSDQQEQDHPSPTKPQPEQLPSKCGDNELLKYYLSNLNLAETPPSYKKLTNARKCRSSEKKSPPSLLEQVKQSTDGESAAKDGATGPVDNEEIMSTEDVGIPKEAIEKPFNINDNLTLEFVERESLDLAEQILQIDNERTIEYERHSGSKGRSVRSRSNVSDDHPSTSTIKSPKLANRHVRKLTYSNEQLDNCVAPEAIELRRTKSDSAFSKRISKTKKKRQKRATTTDQNSSVQEAKAPAEEETAHVQRATVSVEEATVSVQEALVSVEEASVSMPIGTEVKKKRGRPRKNRPPAIETKSVEPVVVLSKDIRENTDKNISMAMESDEKIATDKPATNLLNSTEMGIQMETGNNEPIVDVRKDCALTEKSINSEETELSAEDRNIDVDTAKENHPSYEEKPSQDSNLLSDDVSRETQTVILETSANRRALRSDDRKFALKTQDEQSTPLKGRESRSSRRIPRGDLQNFVDDQMPSMRIRKKNESLASPTPVAIETEKSPAGQHLRSTRKRNMDNMSPLSPLKERVTRSSKRETPVTELYPRGFPDPEKVEESRSSDRSLRSEKSVTLPEISSSSRGNEAKVDNLSINIEKINQPNCKEECQLSHEKSCSNIEKEKTFESIAEKISILVSEKSTPEGEGNVEPELETAKLDPVKEQDDKPSRCNQLNSDLVESSSDSENTQLEDTGKIIDDELKPDEEILKTVESDLQLEDSKLLDKAESTKLDTDINTVSDKPSPELAEEGSEKTMGKLRNINLSEQESLEPEQQIVYENWEIKTNRKKSKKDDSEMTGKELPIQSKLCQEKTKANKDSSKKSKQKIERTKSTEKSVQIEKEPNQKNLEEYCSKEVVVEVISVQENEALVKKDQKLGLLESPVESSAETTALSETQSELVKPEKLSQPKIQAKNTTDANPLNPEECKINEVHIKKNVKRNENCVSKCENVPIQIIAKPETLLQTNDSGKTILDSTEKENRVVAESDPIIKTVVDDENSVGAVDKAVGIDLKSDEIRQTCDDDPTDLQKVVKLTPNLSNEIHEPKRTSSLCKTPKTSQIRFVKKRRTIFGRRRKKYKPVDVVNLIKLESTVPIADPTVADAQSTVPIAEPTIPIAEPADAIAESTIPIAEPTVAIAESTIPIADSIVPIVESTEISQAIYPEIEIYQSSTSSTNVSPTSSSCRKLRVLVKRTPTTSLKAKRKNLVAEKISNRLPKKLNCIIESPKSTKDIEINEIRDKLQPTVFELPQNEQGQRQAEDTIAPNLNQEPVEDSGPTLDQPTTKDTAQSQSECSLNPGSEMFSSETTGVNRGKEPSQLDETAAKLKKKQLQKADLKLSMKKADRRRKQFNEPEQPDKKRPRINMEEKTVKKSQSISVSNRRTDNPAESRKKAAIPTVSSKKSLTQTVIRSDIGLQKPEKCPQKITSSESSAINDHNFITIFTKKSAIGAEQPTRESNRTAQTGAGAAARKVNISVTLIPAKELEATEQNVSVEQEEKQIIAPAMPNIKKKSLARKLEIGQSKMPHRKSHLLKYKKSEPHKSDAYTEANTLANKLLPQGEFGSKLTETEDEEDLATKMQQLPPVETEVAEKDSPGLNKSMQRVVNRRKKTNLRKLEGAKEPESTASRTNVIMRKSLPMARPSQKLSADVGEITLPTSETGATETTEFRNPSKNRYNRKSEPTLNNPVSGKPNKNKRKKLLEAEIASSSGNLSKERLLQDVDERTSNTVLPFMTRSSDCAKSLAPTPHTISEVKSRHEGFQPVAGRVKAKEVSYTRGVNSRRSRKDPDAPMLELVSHGYVRKRRFPRSVAETGTAKRVKQQAELDEGVDKTLQYPETVQAQRIHTETKTLGMEQNDQEGKEQLEELHQEVIPNTEKHQGDIQIELKRAELQQKNVGLDEKSLEEVRPVEEQEIQHEQMQEKEHMSRRDQSSDPEYSSIVNMAFPVMISAAANQPLISMAPVSNPPLTSVKELDVQNSRQCRVRLDRKVVRKWLVEHCQTEQRNKEKSSDEIDRNEKVAADDISNVQEIHLSVEAPKQRVQSVHTSPEKEHVVPLSILPSAVVDNDVKNEEEEVPTALPASQTETNFPQHIPTQGPLPGQQLVRFNAPTTSSANIQNNSVASAGGQQLPFGSTKMFSFLYPMRYQQSYGAVGLDFCCPNLDGPMRAIDPTRLHDKVEVPVLELPQFMVISTKFISKQDKNIPTKVRAKMAEMAKDGNSFVGQSIQIGMNTPDPHLSPAANLAVPASVPTVPIPSLLTLAPTSNPESSSIDILSRQLPRGTTLTKKVLPPGCSLPLPPVSATIAPQSSPRGLIQLPPICPTDKQRMELQTRVQQFDLVLQELSRRATMMTVAERQKTIEEIVKTSTLLPIDVDVGTKLLENYVHYLNIATNTKASAPGYQLNPVVTPTTSISSGAKVSLPTSNSVLAKSTPTSSLPGVRSSQIRNCLPTSIPLYDGDRNIIGYQRPPPNSSPEKLIVPSSSSIDHTPHLIQDQRVVTRPTDKETAVGDNNTVCQRKGVPKSISSKSAWVPGHSEPTIHSLKHIGSGSMISFNSASSQKPTTRPSPATGKVTDAISSTPITTPVPISIPSAPNISSTNVFVVNQVSSHAEECILPDVTNTVPLETEIKGELDEVGEIVS